MGLPTVKINTFVKPEGNIYVDTVSKAFIYFELLLGVNRLLIISQKRILIALFYAYSLIINVLVCYVAFKDSSVNQLAEIIKTTKLLQYQISAVISLFMWKRFHYFYKEIEKFDSEVGCRPKILISSMKLLLSLGTLSAISLFYFPYTRLYVIPLHLITTCEHSYFSCLIDHIITRMRLLNYYLECTISIAKTDSSPKITEFAYFNNDARRFYFPDMRQIMELYQIIVNAHKFLVDAIKWLMLQMVVTSFIFSLVSSYYFMLSTDETAEQETNINGANTIIFDFRLNLLLMSYLQLFPTCISSDRLQEEVNRFKELLSSSLNENQLDRSSRSTARTLLALTKIRNLSFSLLRVLDISVSLPFSFLGLILTYLIILLQFKKVIQS